MNPFEPWQQRVMEEQADLVAKLIKLESFIASNAFSALDAADALLLKLQRNQMSAYLDILDQRIERFMP